MPAFPFARGSAQSPPAPSTLGIGLQPLGNRLGGSDERDVFEMLAYLHETGHTYFDTSPFYGSGLSEHRFGAFLRTIDRDSIVLSTKVGRILRPCKPQQSGPCAVHFQAEFDYSYAGTMRSLEDSMHRLGTSTIDVALIHDVSPRWHGEELPRRYDEAMAGAYRALCELRRCGSVKAIGVGINDCEWLLRFAEDGDFDCFMLAGRYTLLDHSALPALLPTCQTQGIVVLLAAPFNSGILATGARPGARYFYAPAPPDVLARTKRIESLCTRHSVTLASAALQFPTAHPAVRCVVAGFGNIAEARGGVHSAAAVIPEAFWADLKNEGLIPLDAPVPVGP